MSDIEEIESEVPLTKPNKQKQQEQKPAEKQKEK
jgi:hypothetical protein